MGASALQLAKTFAAAEPETVLRHIDDCERRLSLESLDPAHSSLLGLLEAHRPGFALVRSWAGFEAGLRQKDAEIKRLRYIIDRTIVELRHSGAEPSARKIERLVRGMRELGGEDSVHDGDSPERPVVWPLRSECELLCLERCGGAGHRISLVSNGRERPAGVLDRWVPATIEIYRRRVVVSQDHRVW